MFKQLSSISSLAAPSATLSPISTLPPNPFHLESYKMFITGARYQPALAKASLFHAQEYPALSPRHHQQRSQQPIFCEDICTKSAENPQCLSQKQTQKACIHNKPRFTTKHENVTYPVSRQKRANATYPAYNKHGKNCETAPFEVLIVENFLCRKEGRSRLSRLMRLLKSA